MFNNNKNKLSNKTLIFIVIYDFDRLYSKQQQVHEKQKYI